MHKAGHVYSHSVNHAHGQLPCAWFSVRLYTRPAANGGHAKHTACRMYSHLVNRAHSRLSDVLIHSPGCDTRQPNYY